MTIIRSPTVDVEAIQWSYRDVSEGSDEHGTHCVYVSLLRLLRYDSHRRTARTNDTLRVDRDGTINGCVINWKQEA